MPTDGVAMLNVMACLSLLTHLVISCGWIYPVFRTFIVFRRMAKSFRQQVTFHTKRPQGNEKIFVILFTTSSFIFTMSRQSDAPINRDNTSQTMGFADGWWMKIAQILQFSSIDGRLNASRKIPFNVTGRTL